MEKIKPADIVIKCSDCDSSINGEELMNDTERYYSQKHKNWIKFPSSGITKDQLLIVNKLVFSCELCHEKNQNNF